MLALLALLVLRAHGAPAPRSSGPGFREWLTSVELPLEPFDFALDGGGDELTERAVPGLDSGVVERAAGTAGLVSLLIEGDFLWLSRLSRW